ncbi:type II CAAX prenyl endopeptidase Rce1 family protein [Priestia taiwanensis]|uniref:CAAX prenyl protease 2/Lysostaphin resistance protein A-like domain-containing protein n=1 Tax=Priestia taiwanensis TaxID=1347902 RepID=A0A917EMU3_9BACI|nr:CPBP family glutamic-type intramembrane protease [Priestia taiwanensis]GGE58264.1 hypothetical protein GCM10007140_05750 [Priestia taiwanensis]
MSCFSSVDTSNLFFKKHEVSKQWSLIIVTLVGAFLFGLTYYSVYDGNWTQILLIIALARLPFNWVTFKVNSLWAIAIVHITFDFLSLLTFSFI